MGRYVTTLPALLNEITLVFWQSLHTIRLMMNAAKLYNVQRIILYRLICAVIYYKKDPQYLDSLKDSSSTVEFILK